MAQIEYLSRQTFPSAGEEDIYGTEVLVSFFISDLAVQQHSEKWQVFVVCWFLIQVDLFSWRPLMKNMFKSLLLLSALFFSSPYAAMADSYPEKAGRKLENGIANAVGGFLEIPKTVLITSRSEGPVIVDPNFRTVN